MTNEEAIKIINNMPNYKPWEVEALDLAIKALEVTEQVNSSHNGVQMFPKGAFKSIYNESEDEASMLRTKGEQKAYLDGYEMCAKCIEQYLSNEGKKKLECFLVAVRNAVEIKDEAESEDKE